MNADSVAELYNKFTDLLLNILGNNVHLGYWHDISLPISIVEATDAMTDQVIARLDASGGQSVLDIGCGAGKPALRVARRTGAIVTGISVSQYQVDIANEAASAEGLSKSVRFVHAEAHNLPYSDESFDAAWALESMIHMADRVGFLREVARVLRPGGRLVIADVALRQPPHDSNEAAILERFCAAFQMPSLEQIDHYSILINEAGLHTREIADISNNARPSYRVMLAGLRAMRDQFVAIMGADAFDAGVASVEAFAPQSGYVLATAIRV